MDFLLLTRSTAPTGSLPGQLNSAPHRYLIEFSKNHESDLIIHLFTTFSEPILPTGLKDDWWLSQAHPSWVGLGLQ